MNINQLQNLLNSLIGKNINNLGNANQTKIIRLYDSMLTYQRRNSKISINISHLVDAFNNMNGSFSSRDLKSYNQDIFDSAAGGHSCNCTLLMALARLLGLGNIRGKGVRGNPFEFY